MIRMYTAAWAALAGLFLAQVLPAAEMPSPLQADSSSSSERISTFEEKPGLFPRSPFYPDAEDGETEPIQVASRFYGSGTQPTAPLLPEEYSGPEGIRPGPRAGGRPLRLYTTPAIERRIRYFLERRRKALERGFRRSGRYLKMMRRILPEEGVPEEFAYLAAVESNFNPRARSPARAVGLWQFTAPTARKFGLRIRRPWYDERMDPRSSTRAAARLLAYLYDRYHSWELALAAYNAGERRVNRAMRRARSQGKSTDYWSLQLPRQTEDFVPTFMALAKIYREPGAHGLAGVEREPPLRSEVLELQVSATLADLAQRLGMSEAEMEMLNPAWKAGLIPPAGVGRVLLRFPEGSGEKLLASLRTQPAKSIPWVSHQIEEGETVSHIALRYGVPTREVLSLNGLNRKSLISIGQALLVPVPRGSNRAIAADRVAFIRRSRAEIPQFAQRHFHTVQSGESLWTISRRYQVRMTDLRRWNELGGNRLFPEQELVVFLPPRSDTTAPETLQQ